jgi:hypothetical protein
MIAPADHVVRAGSPASLCAENSPATFWKLLDPVPCAEEWNEAIAACARILPASAAAHAGDPERLMEAVLIEGQFGAGHWTLGAAKRMYYDLKPLLARPAIGWLRRIYGRDDARAGGLSWPFESRYADFLHAVLASVLDRRELESARYVSLWPDDRRLAFVLTHDVERHEGHDFVLKVADLDERFGFRSSFNFVPERYRTDPGLVAELKARGFEVGVHDLNHDGKLFRSRAIFDARAERINAELARSGAAGFRAALHHRNPEWMQALNLEYDLSFFDSDPFEPIPGGTMSLWPFMLGRFVELPYTLVQDYTLTEVLGETTPALWLKKVDFLAARRGMALLNTHPDYLRTQKTWKVYVAFLAEMAERTDYWHALPRDVARWWRARSTALPGELPPGAVLATRERMAW